MKSKTKKVLLVDSLRRLLVPGADGGTLCSEFELLMVHVHFTLEFSYFRARSKEMRYQNNWQLLKNHWGFVGVCIYIG